LTVEASGWTIDTITLDLLRAVPLLAEQVRDNLYASTGFMDDLAQIQYEEGSVSRIEIKAWTSKRVIHSMMFRDGSRLGDLRFRIAGGGPIPEALLNSPCQDILGHEIFHGYTWETSPDDNDARIAGVTELALGIEPNGALLALLST
jgi:hypothetical protein